MAVTNSEINFSAAAEPASKGLGRRQWKFVAAAVVIVAGGISIFSFSMGTDGSSTNAFAVLPPAIVPSLDGECSLALTFGADGNPGLDTCSNGEINVLAWRFYAKSDAHVLSAGRGITLQGIYSAMCADVATRHTTFPEVESAAQIASLYYGWHATNQQIYSWSITVCG